MITDLLHIAYIIDFQKYFLKMRDLRIFPAHIGYFYTLNHDMEGEAIIE
tara:strand:- start:89 stop:235 length:147 start_codon:yes stop_codon:yes gene_type:complete